MITLKRLLILLALPLALGACAGEGIKDKSQILSTVQNAEVDSILLFRDTGFQGSATLMPVFLNDKEVGKLGVNESLQIKAPRGTHTLTVKTNSFDSALVKPGVVTVVKDGTKPHFFVVSVTSKFISAEVNVLETTAQSYLASAK